MRPVIHIVDTSDINSLFQEVIKDCISKREYRAVIISRSVREYQKFAETIDTLLTKEYNIPSGFYRHHVSGFCSDIVFPEIESRIQLRSKLYSYGTSGNTMIYPSGWLSNAKMIVCAKKYRYSLPGKVYLNMYDKPKIYAYLNESSEENDDGSIENYI